MYIGAAACAWFLRAWKVSELEEVRVGKERRGMEIKDNDAVPRESRPGLQRNASRVSSLKAAKGLWSWQRV
jgi:hypothetical protein